MRKIFSRHNCKRSIFTLLLILSMLVVAACSSGGSGQQGESSSTETTPDANNNEEVYTLRVATSMDPHIVQMAGYHVFVDLVEERSNGRIKIDYVGGPEAIPSFNQGDAVSNGTIDMTWNASGYYSELVPEALVPAASELTYEEELERGSWEYLSKYHEEKMNAKLLGRAGVGNFSFYVGKGHKIESMKDFNGLRFRGHAMYVPILSSLGADVISMPGEEIYTALERGLIDGFGWINYGALDLGVIDLLTAKILPSFNEMDVYILMNLDAWNKLPEDLQEIIRQAAIDSYFEQSKLVEEALEKENNTLLEHGVEIVELVDGDEFLKLNFDYSWEWLGERVENIDELAKYFRK